MGDTIEDISNEQIIKQSIRIFSKLIGDSKDFEKYFRYLINRLVLDSESIRVVVVDSIGEIALKNEERRRQILPVI